ncbi:MAG: FHA domain-containing protein [Coriobacteriia bacterium]
MDMCPACGARVAPEDRECTTCGARLHGATASFEPIAAEMPASGGDIEASEIAVLVVRKGAEVGERFYLDQPAFTIGRDPESDIFLNDVTVSREHAILQISPDGVTITDAGSLNGTYVNDVRVDKAHLRNGDAVQVGRFQMVFLAGGGN